MRPITKVVTLDDVSKLLERFEASMRFDDKRAIDHQVFRAWRSQRLVSIDVNDRARATV